MIALQHSPKRKKYHDPKSVRRRRKRVTLWLTDPRCAYCRRAIEWPGDATLDHVVPHCRGGTLQGRNAALCCFGCNQAKADRTPEEWLADLILTIERLRSQGGQ